MTIHIAHGLLEFESTFVVPEMHWDHGFPRDADGDQYAVVLVGREKETRMTVAHVVPMNGADMEWVTDQAARDLLRFGIHGNVILKSDQEPAHCGCLDGDIQTPGSAEDDNRGLSRRRLEVERCGGESRREHGEADQGS